MTMAQKVGTLRRHVSVVGVVALVLAVAAVVLVPLVILVNRSLHTENLIGEGEFTLSNYTSFLQDGSTWVALKNTAIFTFGAAILAVLLGTTMAWAVACVNIPGRTVVRVLPILVMLLPPLVKDPAMVILFAPETGLVNVFLHDAFGLPTTTFDLFSIGGMIFVGGIFAAPIAYVIMLSPFEGIDRSLVEASQTLGGHLGRSMFRVVIPMILPALLSAVTLLVIALASGFETPVIIGLPAGIDTYMLTLYQTVNSPSAGLNAAAAQGSVYLLLTVSMVLLYMVATRNERKFVSISGKGHNRIQIESPILRWVLVGFMTLYVIVAFLGPLLVTVMTSIIPFYSAVDGNPFHDFTFDNYKGVFSTPDLYNAVQASAILAVGASIVVVAITLTLAVIALKSKNRLRRLCELIAMAPIAVPSVVYSIGLLLTVLSIPGLAAVAYGSKLTMFVALVIVFLPFAMRLMSSAIIQVPDELIEASRLSGAGFVRSIVTVLLPIVKPAILYTAAVVIILAYRELGAIVFLVAPNVNLVPYVSFSSWVTGGYTILAALNMITLLVPLALVLLLFVIGRAKPSAPIGALKASQATDVLVPIGEVTEHGRHDSVEVGN